MATTTIAVPMKISVATIERGDNRAMPHTPWPEVQPPPRRVPKPTRSPAPAITTQLAGIRTPALAVGIADEPVDNAADARDASGREHQQRYSQADQCAADCSWDWREIVHVCRSVQWPMSNRSGSWRGVARRY